MNSSHELCEQSKHLSQILKQLSRQSVASQLNLNTVYYYSKPISKKKKKNTTKQTNKNQQLFSYNLVTDQIRQQLAAVLERCNQIEKDATEKAEAPHREQERKLRGQLIESQKLRMEAEKAKKAAQESYAAAEATRIIADEERQQLLADRSNTTKDLLKELRRHTKYSNDSSDDDGDSRRPAKKKKKSEQSELFTLDGELKVPAPYEGMDMSNLVMHSQIPNEIVNHIANNEFFDLQEMFSGEELTTAGSSGTKAKTTKPITKKSEIFFLLYTFGMYYLQRFLHKAAGFLEYLAYLTKFGAPFNVPGLLKLDSALRVHYIKHPDWNWDQNNFTIYRTFDLLSRDPENLIPGQQVLKYNPSSVHAGSKGIPVNLSKLRFLTISQPCLRVPVQVTLTSNPLSTFKSRLNFRTTRSQFFS